MKGAKLNFFVGGYKVCFFFVFCLSFCWECEVQHGGPSQFKKNQHLGRKIRQQILEVRHLTKFNFFSLATGTVTIPKSMVGDIFN